MREAGVLLHISSLPSAGGIGTLGSAAYDFVDFLAAAGFRYWQVLPVGVTGYGDSPYQSASAYAGNPYFIDLDVLVKEGFLRAADLHGIDWGDNPSEVDYGKLFAGREEVLRKAAARFCALGGDGGEEYISFIQENAFWLDDFALFMTIKTLNGLKPLSEWSDPTLIRRDAGALAELRYARVDDILFYKASQFFFFRQWFALRAYAERKGIKLIGDMPIYVALDSAEVWSRPSDFLLTEELSPIEVAGVPPDYFSETGQLWGNPLYNWDAIAADGYRWWGERIKHAMRLYHKVRIDHFRGFSAYYAIPADNADARGGRWCKGPGAALFESIARQAPGADIIAEDLGLLDDSVAELLAQTGFPGMKVLQFAFSGEEDNPYLPANYTENCIVYTGTHDNNTASAWFANLTEDELECFSGYAESIKGSPAQVLISLALSSPAALAVIPMQDFLPPGKGARMNTPSTLGQNWKWRMLPDTATKALAKKIKRSLIAGGRAEK